MTAPILVGSDFGGTGPALVLGPSLGTPATLWQRTAALVSGEFHPLGWDLPGHGASPATREAFTVQELADSVIALADDAGLTRFDYAGVSLGGQVGLALAIRYPQRIRRLAVLCSAAKIGSAGAWEDRAAMVRSQGTPALVEGSATRWFAPGFIERHPDRASALLLALSDTDDESYALCCGALASADLRDGLAAITAPTVIWYGEYDTVITADDAQCVAAGVPGGSTAMIGGAAHLPPIEQPEAVASALRQFLGRDAA